MTWGPWLESEDELRVRDLIRDLRAAPESSCAVFTQMLLAKGGEGFCIWIQRGFDNRQAMEAGTTYEVNNVEATAVRLALEEFGEHFESGTCLDLFVDNTSCKEALNRKTSKSDNIARQLRMVLEEAKRKGICIQARYIASSENPADPISRKF